jgi:hypothetical protein
MSWLLGRRSQLSLSNKILLYKCILKPVWTYGIQLWCCAKPSLTLKSSNAFSLNSFAPLSKLLRTLANAPWYISNLQLHTDLGIPFVEAEISRSPFVAAEISRSSLLYHHRLAGHSNALVANLSTPHNVARQLKHRWPSDLHFVTDD